MKENLILALVTIAADVIVKLFSKRKAAEYKRKRKERKDAEALEKAVNDLLDEQIRKNDEKEKGPN